MSLGYGWVYGGGTKEVGLGWMLSERGIIV